MHVNHSKHPWAFNLAIISGVPVIECPDFHHAQTNTEKKLRQVEEQLNESNSKLADHEATIASLTSSQAKLQSETNDLNSQLSDAESKVGTLSKAKSALESQVEDLKSELESETAVSESWLE